MVNQMPSYVPVWKDTITGEQSDVFRQPNYSSYAPALYLLNNWSAEERYRYDIIKDGKHLWGWRRKHEIPETDSKGISNWEAAPTINKLTIKTETQMPANKAFNCLVILHGRPSKDSAGNDVTEDSKVVGGPKILISTNEETAKLMIARDIKLSDEELGRTQVIVRPF